MHSVNTSRAKIMTLCNLALLQTMMSAYEKKVKAKQRTSSSVRTLLKVHSIST